MICDMFTDIFFFNDTAPTEIYTLPLHDALPGPCPATDAARPPRPPPPAGRGLAEASASDPTGALREKPETGVEALLAGEPRETFEGAAGTAPRVATGALHRLVDVALVLLRHEGAHPYPHRPLGRW